MLTIFKASRLTFQLRTAQITPRNLYSNSSLSGGKNVFEENATKWWTGDEFKLLRAMNEIRVPFITNNLNKPISNTKILDVGCGGGILSEPLARLGATVTGIDPVFESINQAQLHSDIDKSRLNYMNCNIEDLSCQTEHLEAFDCLIASEVLEHVQDVEDFLKTCSKLLKPNGNLFLTTINQTPLSYIGVILFGEYILKQLPIGTHRYDMFVNIKGLKVMLERLGYDIRLVSGFMYEPIGGNFHWTPSTLTHYAVCAIKMQPPLKGLNYQQKRYMAQAKSSVKKPKRPLDDQEMSTVIPYDRFKRDIDSLVSQLDDTMVNAITPRVSVKIIEKLPVALTKDGESYELGQIARIIVKSPNLILIDLSLSPESVKPVTLALRQHQGNMGIQVDVNTIFLTMPQITREYKEELAKLAEKKAKGTISDLKNLFSTYSGIARDAKGVPKDTVYAAIENLQYQINLRKSTVDGMLKKKVDVLLNQKN